MPWGNPLGYLPISAYVNDDDRSDAAQESIDYESIENRLLIFPSSLHHEVEPYKGEIPRYSVTYDIIITGKENTDEVDNEMSIIHPTQWGLL